MTISANAQQLCPLHICSLGCSTPFYVSLVYLLWALGMFVYNWLTDLAPASFAILILGQFVISIIYEIDTIDVPHLLNLALICWLQACNCLGNLGSYIHGWKWQTWRTSNPFCDLCVEWTWGNMTGVNLLYF